MPCIDFLEVLEQNRVPTDFWSSGTVLISSGEIWRTRTAYHTFPYDKNKKVLRIGFFLAFKLK